MSEPVRPSTVLPAVRTPFTVTTEDGCVLVGEVAAPLTNPTATLLMFHPNPTGGGMMDSHIYKKASNRLPAMAGVTTVRFNTRGTTSEAGTSTGSYDNGNSERFDVEAMERYVLDELKLENVWVVGWSFGTEIALRHVRDSRIKGLILLSPTMLRVDKSDLERWAADGRPVIALIPEFDDYLTPVEAPFKFRELTQIQLINVDGAKHLWVGEPAVNRVLTEIVKVVALARLPLPTEI
jgi:alpha/beta superfamily hydrolase